MTAIFRATHWITLDSGETQEVMLDDGRAYTREEWDAADASDYERTEDGNWLFQGQPFAGTVREMTDADRTQWLYREAESRVRGDDRLAPHAATILDDHGDGDDHWRWVIDAEADEIVSWAEAHR